MKATPEQLEALLAEAERVTESSFGELNVADLRAAIREALIEKLKAERGTEYAYAYLRDVFRTFIISAEDDPATYETRYYKRTYSVSGTTVTIGGQEMEVELSWVARLAGDPTASSGDSILCCEAVKRGEPTREAVECQARESVDRATFLGSLQEATFESGAVKGIVPIRPGQSLNGSIYPEDVLQRDSAIFNGMPVFLDHQDPGQPKPLANLVGVLENARWDAVSKVPRADLRYPPSKAGLIEEVREMHALLGDENVGFSIDMKVKARYDRQDGRTVKVVEALVGGGDASTDIVWRPAAGGGFDRALESAQADEELEMLEGLKLEDLKAGRPDLVQALEAELAAKSEEPAVEPVEKEEAAVETVNREAIVNDAKSAAVEAAREAVLLATRQAKFEAKVSEAKVPQRIKDQMLADAEKGGYTQEACDTAFSAWLNTAAELGGGAQVTVHAGSLKVTESVDKRYARLLAAAGGPRELDGQRIQPFTGLREAILSFHPELAQMVVFSPQQFAREALNYLHWGGGDLAPAVESRSRESIISTTFNLAWADVTNKMLYKAIEDPELNVWRPLVSDYVSFNDLTNSKKVIQVGGYNNVPVVAEGQPYGYATTPTQEKVEMTASKYGYLEEYTMESALADDLRVLARIPQALGQAWAQTVYDTVFGLFTANSGDGATYDPDSLALYDASHNNATNTAFTAADLIASEQKFRDQLDISNGKRKNYRAKFLLYANEGSLRASIWEALNSMFKVNPLSTSGSQVNLPNIIRDAFGLIPIEVNYPDASTTRWELVADPSRFGTIAVGALNGRFEPDLFVQDMEREGSVFTADKITYKLRATLGLDVLNYRSFSRGRK